MRERKSKKDGEEVPKMIDWTSEWKEEYQSVGLMEKTVFWIGPEINEIAPTNLPTMRELVMYTIELICGQKKAEHIENRVNEFNLFMQEIIYNAGVVLNPKTLIAVWNHIEGVELNQSIKNYTKASFNYYHCLSALNLIMGADIVTLNVDLCIEKAFSAMTNGEYEMELVDRENGVYVYGSTRPGSGKIFHIHGCCENIADLGRVFQLEKPIYSKYFRDLVIHWVTSGYHLYFLDQSSGDAYDVNLFFHYLLELVGKMECQAIHVTTKMKREQSRRMQGILGCFENVSTIHRKNEDFIRWLYKNKTKCPEWLLDARINAAVNAQKKEEFDWKKLRREEIYAAKEYWNIILLYVQQATSVSVCELNPSIYQYLENMSFAAKNMYASLLMRYQRDIIPVYGYSVKETSIDHNNPIERELYRMCGEPYNRQNIKIAAYEKEALKLQKEYLLALRRGEMDHEIAEQAQRLRARVTRMLPDEKNGKLVEIPIMNFKENSELYRIHGALRSITCRTQEHVKMAEHDFFRSYFYCCYNGNKIAIMKTLCYAINANLIYYYKFGKKSYYDKAQRYKTLCKKQENSELLLRKMT